MELFNENQDPEKLLSDCRLNFANLFKSDDSLTIDKLDSADLNKFKPWLKKIIKNANKLQSNLEFDFVTEMMQMRK